MKYISILCILLFASCASKKFTLEESSNLHLKDAFYEIIPPAIKEGNTFVKITLLLSKENNHKEVQLNGVYFKNQYAKLVAKNDSISMASIILPKQSDIKKDVIPFDIESGKIVVAYDENEKQKFALFPIKIFNRLNPNSIPK